MTEEEIRTKSKEKMDKVKAFCEALQVSFSAKQRLNSDMVLECIVVFTDEEKYPSVTRAPETAQVGNVTPQSDPVAPQS